ncbi:MAG: hypothetical protein KY457_01185 [Actinobacteria bacterium]|nr:hypothetical protein [Actinomycetota bacterium]
MTRCRCDVLNVMSGDAASDYAVQHLDRVREDGQGQTYYRCPETGTAWVEERAPDTYAGESRRLRRTDRSRI